MQLSQFEVQSMAIISPNKNFSIDVSSIYEELNIYDSVLFNTISGNIFIADAVGSLKGFDFDGSEYLSIKLSKEGELFQYSGIFKIYSQGDKKMLSLGSTRYRLNFISPEYIDSIKTKVVQFYSDTYSNIAEKIMKDYLNVPTKKLNGVIEMSQGVRDVTIPTLEPLDAITWCSKRALDINDKPTFLFFENTDGYNFTSIANIFKQTPLANINFSPKNVIDNFGSDFLGVRDYEVIDQYDFVESVKSGVYAKTYRGYDIARRTFVEIQSDSFKDQVGVTAANPNKNKTPDGMDLDKSFYSQIVSYFYNSKPKNNEERPEKWLLQRESILRNLFAKKVRIEMAGNYDFTSGKLLNVYMPKFSVITDNDKENGLDKNLYGKYLIIATRHKMTAQGRTHTTIMDLVTDSTN
jgi:hypothetical protein